MNVLLVASDNYVASGAFNSMVFVAKEMIAKENNVLVTVPYKGSGDKLLKDNNIPFIVVKSYDWIIEENSSFKHKVKKIIQMLINIKAYYKYKKIIKQNNIEIVHNNTTYTYIAAKAAIAEKKKLVWHLREFLEEDQNKKIIFRKFGYKLINKSDKIICISKKIYEKYQNIFDNDKMEVVHNGIDVKKYYLENREIFKQRSIKLLCVGAVREKKGSFDLCEAIGIVKSRTKFDFELNLVGLYDAEGEEKIKSIEKKYNIHCINLLGLQTDTKKYYSESDITFMCSTNEAFGRVTVEAMLAGSLVIGADAGGTSEIIKDNETGLLYESKNVEDLANKIEYALNNKEKMKEIAKYGQKYAKENFNSELNAENIMKVYKKIF